MKIEFPVCFHHLVLIPEIHIHQALLCSMQKASLVKKVNCLYGSDPRKGHSENVEPRDASAALEGTPE